MQHKKTRRKVHKISLYFFLTIIFVLTFSYTFFVYSSSSAFSVSLGISHDLNSSEPVILSFFHAPIDHEGYVSKIQIIPETPYSISWEEDFTRLKITPVSFWQPEMKYTIILPEATSKIFTTIKNTRLVFTTEQLPHVQSITPQDNTDDIVLDIEDPIKITFDKSTNNSFIRFTLNPSVDVIYQNNADKTIFEILPLTALQAGEKYTLTIDARHLRASDNDYKKIFSSTFTTRIPEPSNWSKNHSQRLEQARKFTKPKLTEGKYIDVNIDAQIMTAFEDGVIINTFMISSGRSGLDTPKGTHKIFNKSPRPWSAKYELYMPYWMAFTSGGSHGIHELPEWPSGYKEGQNHLGIPVSHGCVRLGVGSAKFMYNWAEIGTPVIIY